LSAAKLLGAVLADDVALALKVAPSTEWR